MPRSPKSKDGYFGVNDAWVLDKFTTKEIALFLKEGVIYFEFLKETKESKQYLETHPEFAEVFEKW